MNHDNDALYAVDLGGDGEPDLSLGVMDSNHDGSADSFGVEANLFGESDLNLGFGDADADGNRDVALRLDFDGDKRTDIGISVGDQTGDWWPDSVEAQADLNGDGNAEISARAHDVTGLLSPDLVELKLDFTSDGESELDMGIVDVGAPVAIPVPGSLIEQLWDDPGTASDLVGAFPENPFESLDASLGGFTGPGLMGQLLQIHGTPEADLDLWEMQDEPFSCAVASTSMVLRSVGVDASEADLAAAFEQFGIYDPNSGTNPHLIDEVVNFLAARDGLDVHAQEIHNFSSADLTQMLDAGIRPLVGLDAAELYPDALGIFDRGLEMLYELFDLPFAGHAVQVTGIVETEEGRMVVLNDPGMPEGGLLVPLDGFMDAANDFDWTAMMITPV